MIEKARRGRAKEKPFDTPDWVKNGFDWINEMLAH